MPFNSDDISNGKFLVFVLCKRLKPFVRSSGFISKGSLRTLKVPIVYCPPPTRKDYDLHLSL